MGSASPFNIVSKSLTLRNFSRDEVAALYGQHSEPTGQAFSAPVVDRYGKAERGRLRTELQTTATVIASLWGKPESSGS